MNTASYQTIPAPPENISAASIIIRMIDGLMFRYNWSLDGLDDSFLLFRPTTDSMTVSELLNHIHLLAVRLHRCFAKSQLADKEFSSLDEVKRDTLKVLISTRAAIEKLNDHDLLSCKYPMKRAAGGEVSFWYLINGPLADALTHVGQINSWRRIAGHPSPGIDVFLGIPPSK